VKIIVVAGVILLIGAIVFPVLIPFMTDYRDANSGTLSSGTSFLNMMVDGWPLVVPAFFLFAIVVLIKMRGGSSGA